MSTAKFRREAAPRPAGDIPANEVRVTLQGKMQRYIKYAMDLLEKGDDVDEVRIRAMGRAIHKAVSVAEVVKRRMPQLHQVNEIGSIDVDEAWEPLEEGLDRVETTRHVSFIVIALSKSPPADVAQPGYQAPA